MKRAVLQIYSICNEKVSNAINNNYNRSLPIGKNTFDNKKIFFYAFIVLFHKKVLLFLCTE